MKGRYYYALLFFAMVAMAAQCNKTGSPAGGRQSEAEMWVTKADQSVLLKKMPLTAITPTSTNALPVIEVNTDTKYQTVEGFGYTLTGGSAMLINKMEATAKDKLLHEVFGRGSEQIGVSYLRVSIGASDLDASVFSYNDLPEGQTDVEQAKFNIAPDRTHLIPILKAILAINPAIKIIAAPWSPPAWMKDNNKSIGGSLKPEYYDSYAKYFVKYVQAMKAEGINITAVTPQNEPLHPGNNPSLLMLPEQQRDFIKNSLGPAFQAAVINTKIVVYDHNLDRPDYPETILKDPGAAKYVDGSAFHLYAGDVNVMGEVHKKFPDKNLYFTEQWTGSKGTFDGDLQWHVKTVIIGTIRNWSKIALEWNLANDPAFNPHTPGGCTECKGAFTIDGSGIQRNVSYYIIAHASKFVTPGSVRIESSNPESLPNVVFLRPDGKKVMIAVNEKASPYTFNLKSGNKIVPVKIDGNTVVTIVF